MIRRTGSIRPLLGGVPGRRRGKRPVDDQAEVEGRRHEARRAREARRVARPGCRRACRGARRTSSSAPTRGPGRARRTSPGAAQRALQPGGGRLAASQARGRRDRVVHPRAPQQPVRVVVGHVVVGVVGPHLKRVDAGVAHAGARGGQGQRRRRLEAERGDHRRAQAQAVAQQRAATPTATAPQARARRARELRKTAASLAEGPVGSRGAGPRAHVGGVGRSGRTGFRSVCSLSCRPAGRASAPVGDPPRPGTHRRPRHRGRPAVGSRADEPRVRMGLLFYPRGGSAQVIRYLAASLARVGWTTELVCGSLGRAGRAHPRRDLLRGARRSRPRTTARRWRRTGGAGPARRAGARCTPPSRTARTCPTGCSPAVAPELGEHLADFWDGHAAPARSAAARTCSTSTTSRRCTRPPPGRCRTSRS